MQHWMILYTYKTWQEFLQHGQNITGFPENRWKSVQKIKKGDIFLCYMTGISRFFAIHEVTDDPYYDDENQIWSEKQFPCRVPVRNLLALEPEHSVPVKSLKEQLSYFQNLKTPNAWSGHFRQSPTREQLDDAQVIVAALEDAHHKPVSRAVDEKKLNRTLKTYSTPAGVVSIPDADSEDTVLESSSNEGSSSHTSIQWGLLRLGEEMGLGLWVARNDRSRIADFGDRTLNQLRDTLPVQFDEATNKTIELIDVLWLSGNTIVAAFEIEHTSAIYSGLLRMADLITMQPNINIPLYIVAPDERRNKVLQEINRPVFARLRQPLPEICRFIPYSELESRIEQAVEGGFLKYLKPEFLDEIAESVAFEGD